MTSVPSAGSAELPGGSRAEPGYLAAVLGSPILHSLSPVIHRAGYAQAGLDWSYTRIECAKDQLAPLVAGMGPRWRGLSLTMPLKEVALEVAATVDPVAEALGAANTLVRRPEGWHATNTDAPGMVEALRWAGVEQVSRMAVLGAGGTARAAIGAAARLGAAVTVYARRPAAVDQLAAVAGALGVDLTGRSLAEAEDCTGSDVVVSTLPKGIADGLAAAEWQPGTVLFDVVYDPWPTPIAEAAGRVGAPVVSGLDLLLAQAVLQFELFCGVPADLPAMRSALLAARAG